MKSEIFAAKLKADPNNQLFRFSYGQALLSEGRAAEAVEHLTYCAKQRNDWMLARILLGKALIASGEPESAKPILQDALKLAVEQHHEDPETEVRALLADLA